MHLVRGGKIVWSYHNAAGRGEISDATLLSNGNVLFAHQFGVTLLAPDKSVLRNYDAPPQSEVHTAKMIGRYFAPRTERAARDSGTGTLRLP